MTAPLYRVGFASCARIAYQEDFDNQLPCILDARDFLQPVWGQIAEQHQLKKLDAMLLLGDQVYSNYGLNQAPEKWTEARFHSVMAQMYGAQYEKVAGFKDLFFALKAKDTQIGAIWDDHDFGYNNASGLSTKFKDKLQSTKELFKQFVATLKNPTPAYPPKPALPIAEPASNVERINNPIKLGNDVEIILLDSRFDRAKNSKKGKEILGVQQWDRLKAKLQTWDTNKLLIVCMGSPYSASGVGGDQSWEQGKTESPPYAHFDEFTQLAKQSRIIFLSGDIHENAFIDHGSFCEVISSGAHLPGDRQNPRYGLLNIYNEKVEVKLFKNNIPENHLSKTINRATGSVQP